MSEKSKLKFIILSQGWDGFSVGFGLHREGFDVTIGQIQDVSELKNGDSPEDPKVKEMRLSQYQNMFKIVPAKKLVKALIKVEDKENYFVFCDKNSLWFYAEILIKAGFTKGLFPLKSDFEFEKNRDEAMAFVKKNYPEIKLIPFNEFSKSDEAIRFLEANPGVYVVQSKGDYVSTVVPTSDEEEQATAQIIGQIEKNKALYDKGGLILKTKLINPVEFTPQIVFFNGEPVFTDVDIETKNLGDSNNNGNQVGCGTNLIISTDLDEKINKIAFPPIIYEMAKSRVGLFVWDISIYLHEGNLYFGEFCSNRLGYDACQTEMDMSGGAGKYFTSIAEGKNPLKKRFGAGIRVFNLNKSHEVRVGIEGIEEHVWFYEVKGKDGEIVSIGNDWDLGVITASDNDIAKAIDLCYNNKDKFVFKEAYTRTKADFKEVYPTSIIHRFNEINHKYIEAPEFKDDARNEEKFKMKLDKINEEHSVAIEQLQKENEEFKKAIREEIKKVLYEDL